MTRIASWAFRSFGSPEFRRWGPLSSTPAGLKQVSACPRGKMAVRKRNPRLRLKKWATDEWYYTNGLYRFIKGGFQWFAMSAAGIRSRGAEHIPRTGPVLLAINHFSWADPVVVGAVLERPAFYLAKERLFRNKIVARLLEGMGQIKVDRHVAGSNEGAIEKALELLEMGLIVGVFPEGTRSRPGEVKRGKTGIARIAARSGVPVIPIAITTDRYWPRQEGFPRWGEPTYINIGAPMVLDVKPEDADDRDKMREATDDVMARIRELLAEAHEARERGAAWT